MRSEDDIRERREHLVARVCELSVAMNDIPLGDDLVRTAGLRGRLRAEAEGLAWVLEIEDKEA